MVENDSQKRKRIKIIEIGFLLCELVIVLDILLAASDMMCFCIF